MFDEDLFGAEEPDPPEEKQADPPGGATLSRFVVDLRVELSMRFIYRFMLLSVFINVFIELFYLLIHQCVYWLLSTHPVVY